MNKKVLATALLCFSLLLIAPLVSAAPDPCPEGRWAAEDIYRELYSMSGFSNPRNVLLAYDEETDAQYAKDMTVKALARFPWEIPVVATVTWDSDDNYDLYEGLLEVEQELNWNRGMYWGDVRVNMLIAWTGQANDNPPAGLAHLGCSAMIIRCQAWWTDDNTVQEEVGHIFGLDHCDSDDCVMSNLYKFWTFIWEDGVLVSIWSSQHVGAISQKWCNDHYLRLLESEGIPMKSVTDGSSDIISEPAINPVNPPPTSQGLNPPTFWTYFFQYMPIWLPTLIVVGIVVWQLHRRRRRLQSRPAGF